MHSYKIPETIQELIKSKIQISDTNNYNLFKNMYAECFFHTECMITCDSSKQNKEISICRNAIQKEYLYSEKLLNQILTNTNTNVVKHDGSYFTHAFTGKTILVICDYTNNFKNKLHKNIFLNCTFIYLQFKINEHVPWFNNFISLCKELKTLKTEFDIALCDCHGLSNIIGLHIYNNLNKSAISLQDSLKIYLKS